MSKCYKHPDKNAVGSCRSCGKNLCETCVAQQKAGISLCYDCAVKVTLDEFNKVEKRDHVAAAERKQEAIKEAKRDTRRGPRPFSLFVIIGTIIVFVQVGIVLADYLMRTGTETSVIWSGMMQTRYERDVCTQNLHYVSTRIQEYKKTHDGALPPDLEAIGIEAGSVLFCPSSGKPYSYVVDGSSFTISCPSPEEHELGFLSSRDGTIMWRR